MKTFLEIFGWYGTAVIVGGYFLNSFGLLESTSVWYQLLNVTGALGIVVVSYYKKAYQPMVLNVIWTVIGVIALVKIFY